jgi:galactokinase
MSAPPRLVAAFEACFDARPAVVVRAPGRVNLIGEHTDYNDGFVLPAAIDRAAWIALRRRPDRRVVVHSLDFAESAEFDLDEPERGGPGWSEYLKATAWALREARHPLCGWDGVLAGDVPIGAGLSSSAAVELAAARAFAAVSGWPWDAKSMALLAQRAENEWVGVKCGIMDQLVSAAAEQGTALLIDCRSLDTQAVPVPSAVSLAVLDTATRRGLVDSAYNERRSQCEAAARLVGVKALRDATLEKLEAKAAQLGETAARRARHVISENARTRQAAAALRRGDLDAVGGLMNESHASLRDDFEVSSPALDAMVAAAQADAACFGARMTGAGFGGCAVALVRSAEAEPFLERVAAAYCAATGHTPATYLCRPSAGASVVELTADRGRS